MNPHSLSYQTPYICVHRKTHSVTHEDMYGIATAKRRGNDSSKACITYLLHTPVVPVIARPPADRGRCHDCWRASRAPHLVAVLLVQRDPSGEADRVPNVGGDVLDRGKVGMVFLTRYNSSLFLA